MGGRHSKESDSRASNSRPATPQLALQTPVHEHRPPSRTATPPRQTRISTPVPFSSLRASESAPSSRTSTPTSAGPSDIHTPDRQPRRPTKEGTQLAPAPLISPIPIPRVTSAPRTPISSRQGTPVLLLDTGSTIVRSLTPVTLSPKSDATRSSVSSTGIENTALWSLQEEWQKRKKATRLPTLCAVGRHGRPCYFRLAAVIIQGPVPPDSMLQITLYIRPDHNSSDDSLVLPALTACSGVNVVEGGPYLLPNVASKSLLTLSATLADADIGSLSYPLHDVQATVHNTEIQVGLQNPRSPAAAKAAWHAPILHALRAELEFCNNRSSGAAWVELVLGIDDVRRAFMVLAKDVRFLESQSVSSKEVCPAIALRDIDTVYIEENEPTLTVRTRRHREVVVRLSDRWACLHWTQLIKRAGHEAVFGMPSAAW